jgi:hypothetical protein
VKPLTPTRKTPTHGPWVGVSRVGVRVGLAYPRVTHAIPYMQQHPLDKAFFLMVMRVVVNHTTGNGSLII